MRLRFELLRAAFGRKPMTRVRELAWQVAYDACDGRPPLYVSPEVHVYLDDQELRARIRDEIAKNNAALVESLSKQPG